MSGVPGRVAPPSGEHAAPPRPGPPHLAPRGPTHRSRGPRPCRVTNERKEMMVPAILEKYGLDDEDHIIVGPDNPPPPSYRGPLERTVSTEFSDALMDDETDPEAQEWWFTEPEGGWKTEKRRLRKVEVIPTEFIDDVRHAGEAAAGRAPVGGLRPGDMLAGTVVKHMLLHGIQVDVGADADGLVAVRDYEAWQRLGDAAPGIGERIEVVVHAVRDEPVYRFPLQLMPTDKGVAERLPPPEQHLPPLDLRDVPADEYEALAERTGRPWRPQKVVVPLEGGAYDVDEEGAPTFKPLVDFSRPERPAPEVTAEMLDELDAIASGWL